MLDRNELDAGVALLPFPRKGTVQNTAHGLHMARVINTISLTI